MPVQDNCALARYIDHAKGL